MNRPPSRGSGRAVGSASGIEARPAARRTWRDGMARPTASPVAGLLVNGTPDYKSGTGEGLYPGGPLMIGKSLSAAGATG